MHRPMLARSFNRSLVGKSVKGWLMSEKCDGVRALWDGFQFISREGNVLGVPAQFIAAMPAGLILEGELWAGRGNFQKMVSLLRSQKKPLAGWAGVTFMVFDAPDARGSFEQRIQIARLRAGDCAFIRVLDQTPIRDHRHMRVMLKEVIKAGGEGLVLRAAGSAYISGRSKSMLKLKPIYTAEAVVTSHEAGVMVLRWGATIFRLCAGLSAAQVSCLPAIGTTITFSHLGLTDAGVPRSAAFLEVRDYE